jgi:hypothetical protein
MESLESKLDRLTPDQRKEVEDFVDFLMGRSGNSHESFGTATGLPSSQYGTPPPLLPTIEPVYISNTLPIRQPDHLRAGDFVSSEDGERAGPPVIREIGSSPDDPVSHDYMDYGQFEQQHSPAVEAVKKVKEKLSRAEEHDRSKHLLDWID